MSAFRKILIYKNEMSASARAAESIAAALAARGFELAENASQADLILCVGGDGTFLRALRESAFPDTPFLGVNTGHLGFFQEFTADAADALAERLQTEDLSVQQHRLLEAEVCFEDGSSRCLLALNDVLVRDLQGKLAHLRLAIGDSFIENFAGDGILACTPAGSTAHNYSLGGSIVDPRLALLQITPIAPMNTSAYRVFTSSLLLPPDVPVSIEPAPGFPLQASLIVDGDEHPLERFSRIELTLSARCVRLLRLPGYDFWAFVQGKLL